MTESLEEYNMVCTDSIKYSWHENRKTSSERRGCNTQI